MIQRVNLIEREVLRFTYEQILKGAIILPLIFLALYAFQTAMSFYLSSEEKTLSADIERLKNQREENLKNKSKTIEPGPMMELSQIFSKNPDWSKFLSDLTLRMPASVWLTSIKTSNASGNSVVMQGISHDSLDLSDFLNRLSQSPFIANPVLSTSKREEDIGFTFSIECSIVIPK